MGRKKKTRTSYEIEIDDLYRQSTNENFIDDYYTNYSGRPTVSRAEYFYVDEHIHRELYPDETRYEDRIKRSLKKRVRKGRNPYQDASAWDEINEQLSKHGKRAIKKRKRRTRCQNNRAARRAMAFVAGVAGIKNPIPKRIRRRKHRC